MEKVHITAIKSQPIVTCKQKFSLFYPQKGSVTIELDAFGEYTVNTIGISEYSAKRTAEYKKAFSKVTKDMVRLYEDMTEQYTFMHLSMHEVKDISFYEKELINLVPKKYHRASFTLAKPTKNEVEEDLRNEYKNINFGKKNSHSISSEFEFIKKNLGYMIERRQQGWLEANDLFSKFEDVREERENAIFFTEYKNIYNKKQSYISGIKSEVINNISSICSSLQIPFDLSISYEYIKDAHLLIVDMIFEDGINIPTDKATILSNGRISIKNKFVKELISDKTNSILSCTYYISSYLFSASPNIEYLRLSVFDRIKQNPLLWVEFNRIMFSRIRPKNVDLYSDILGYPNVINFKVKGDSLEISPIDLFPFKKEIIETTDKLNSDRNITQSLIKKIDEDNIAVSYEYADKLMKVPGISDVVRRAIAVSKDETLPYVILDKHYKGILEEIIRA